MRSLPRNLLLAVVLLPGLLLAAAPRLDSGEVMVPARPIPQTTLVGPEGSWPAGAWLRHWSLVVAAHGRCDGACGRMLSAAGGAFEQLGPTLPREFRLLVVTDAPPSSLAARAGVIVLGGEQGAAWLDEVALVPGQAVLVDPLLRVRARFPQPPPPDRLAADLLAVHARYAPECCVSDGPPQIQWLGPPPGAERP